MTPIFAMSSHVAQPYPAAARANDSSNVHLAQTKAVKPKAQEPANVKMPEKDEYLPEEKQEPTGRYWLQKTEEGKSKGSDKNAKPEPEICRGNNDKIEREIKQLKEKKKTLEQQIQAETDEVKAKKLEQELNQVENELRQKDNDSYRQQHTIFSVV